tara:strand:- start:14 stop:424 length:411 start_codon:yes stop_codon:yes gene_type:complete
MRVHVLLYNASTENEGIHSLEINDKTVVLMFEVKDDAERYSGLLEAQDFPCPTVHVVEREEIETFCDQAGYEARFVKGGFIPQSQEDRLMISPPQSNLEVNEWGYNSEVDTKQSNNLQKEKSDALEKFRKNLENLL